MPLKAMAKITKELFEEILEIYALWKELDFRLRKVSSRGVNIHEGISEVIVCYVNGFEHSVGAGYLLNYNETQTKKKQYI